MGINDLITSSDTPYQRGDADRYYGRPYDPHKRGPGGVWIRDLTDDERAEYERGYYENPSDRKDWGE